jgi:hypothetical protein
VTDLLPDVYLRALAGSDVPPRLKCYKQFTLYESTESFSAPTGTPGVFNRSRSELAFHEPRLLGPEETLRC